MKNTLIKLQQRLDREDHSKIYQRRQLKWLEKPINQMGVPLTVGLAGVLFNFTFAQIMTAIWLMGLAYQLLWFTTKQKIKHLN